MSARADGDSRMLLYALNLDVVERHLFWLLVTTSEHSPICPSLTPPASETDLAGGFTGPARQGVQTVLRTGTGPVAAAPRPGPSLGTLVHLSAPPDIRISDPI